MAFSLGASPAAAQSADVCARADQRLAEKGRGDRDFDGMSNCRERQILETSPRDDDSYDDGISDDDDDNDGVDDDEDDDDDDD